MGGLCAAAAHRGLAPLPREQHQARRQARERRETPESREADRRRGGGEATTSRADRRTGSHRARDEGVEGVHLEQVAEAAALTVIRLAGSPAGTLRTRARTSHLRRALRPTG